MLLLSACAAGPEYHQGAYRPAPPVFVPSQDAPHTVGQPGHLAPRDRDYPKSPHKRPLPPAREPGVWAGDGPRASGEPVTKPELFKLHVPVPEGDHGAPTALICANRLGHAAIDTGDWPDAVRGPEPMRQCLIGHLMAECTLEEAKAMSRLPPESALRKRAEAAHAAALRHKVKACHVAPLDDAATNMRDRILEQWRRNS
jgi:hypothetical protein